MFRSLNKLMGRRSLLATGVFAILFLAGCATPPVPFDYSAFKESRPASMVVLPPINESPEVNAGYGVLAHATLPLAEAGYYVLPVSLVNDTFRENGMTVPVDIHALPVDRIRKIFGADAAVYLRILKYGTSYALVASETLVQIEGRVVDLRSGRELWKGSAQASSRESEGANQAGLAGLLIRALVNQIVGTATDAGFNYAALANQRLLGAPRVNGMLFGPRSQNYKKDPP